MIDIQKLLYEEAKRVISSWTEQDIYAISFFIYSNEEYRYKRLENLTEFSIGYNTESYLKDASPYSEKRWNFAFWPMNNEEIIDVGNGPDTANDNFHILLQWYFENNIKNPGKEGRYDECPIGCMMLTKVITSVALQLQNEGFIKEKFHKDIPIIIHDLSYSYYTVNATRKANPHGEANQFLTAIKTHHGQYEVDLSIELSDQIEQTLYAWKDEKIQLVKCIVYDELDALKIIIGYSKTINEDDIKEKELFTIKKDNPMWLSYKKDFKPCIALDKDHLQDDIILLQACAYEIKSLLRYDFIHILMKQIPHFVIQRNTFDEVSNQYTYYINDNIIDQ
ncbi:MAG: hypothetical protein ACLSUR_17560 [Coprobacillus cateniformis]